VTVEIEDEKRGKGKNEPNGSLGGGFGREVL
jgi:hypothetical protein